MNILITSGSIIETIDDVYYIGQRTDASIGAVIGEAFSKEEYVDNVFFLYGDKSRFPWQSTSANDQKFFFDDWKEKVSLYSVNDLKTLKHTLDSLFEAYQIDVVIHLMSIPNYGDTSVHLLKDADDAMHFVHQLAQEFGFVANLSAEKSAESDAFASTFGKMKTGYQQAVLTQRPQERMLAYIQSLTKTEATVLVSGKIEYNVSEEDLLRLAQNSLTKNGSHFVIATDIESHKKGDEEGYYIIDKSSVLSTKRLDADDLAEELAQKFRV